MMAITMPETLSLLVELCQSFDRRRKFKSTRKMQNSLKLYEADTVLMWYV